MKLLVSTEKGAGVIVDQIQGEVHVVVIKAGRGKSVVVVQGTKIMRGRGIQVKIGIENLTGLTVHMKGREREMIGTENGVGLREVKIIEPEKDGTELAIVTGTGIRHAQNMAHLMVTKRGQDLGRKVEMLTRKAGSLKN